MTSQSTVIILLGCMLALSPATTSARTTTHKEQSQKESSTSNKIAYWATGVGIIALALCVYYYRGHHPQTPPNSSPPPPGADKGAQQQPDTPLNDPKGKGKPLLGERVGKAVSDIAKGTFGRQSYNQASGSGSKPETPGQNDTASSTATTDPQASGTSPVDPAERNSDESTGSSGDSFVRV